MPSYAFPDPDFKVPDEVEVKLVEPRDFLDPESTRAEIGIDNYGLTYKIFMTWAERTQGTFESIKRIMEAHTSVGAKASLEDGINTQLPIKDDPGVREHVALRRTVCACGKRGYVFTFGALSRKAIMYIEYTCKYCGNTKGASINHRS